MSTPKGNEDKKFKTGERRSDERLTEDLEDTERRSGQEGVEGIGEENKEAKTFSEKESHTAPDCARHRSRKGPLP